VKLERLRRERAGAWVRAAADVVWEDAALAPETLFFEVPERLGDDLLASPEAFALAALPAAAWRGERRLRVDARLCPRLAAGLEGIQAIWLRAGSARRPVEIEAAAGLAAPARRSGPRAALLLSGGVDSLALLRRDRLERPRSHPESIRDGVVLFGANGFEFAQGAPVPERLAAYDALLRRLGPLAEAEGLELVPLRFNARWLLPGYPAWRKIGYAPMIAAAVHVLSRRCTLAWLASSGGFDEKLTIASHPDLDPFFSTSALEIRPGDPYVSRLEKVRRIADWEMASAIVQPCWQRSSRLADGRLNCGRCEKCLRTMLALLAVGKLRGCAAFAEDDVEPDWIRRAYVPTARKMEALLETREMLARIGRRDLVRALDRRARAFYRRRRRERVRRWLGAVAAAATRPAARGPEGRG
jgi:hypothetical protein